MTTDNIRKQIIKNLEIVGFTIDIKSSQNLVNLIDMTFNLNNGTYKANRTQYS